MGLKCSNLRDHLVSTKTPKGKHPVTTEAKPSMTVSSLDVSNTGKKREQTLAGPSKWSMALVESYFLIATPWAV